MGTVLNCGGKNGRFPPGKLNTMKWNWWFAHSSKIQQYLTFWGICDPPANKSFDLPLAAAFECSKELFVDLCRGTLVLLNAGIPKNKSHHSFIPLAGDSSLSDLAQKMTNGNRTSEASILFMKNPVEFYPSFWSQNGVELLGPESAKESC